MRRRKSIERKDGSEKMKCHFCGRENEDVTCLEFHGRKSLPTCPSCLKKSIIYMLDFNEFLKDAKP